MNNLFRILNSKPHASNKFKTPLTAIPSNDEITRFEGTIYGHLP
jgi:hypothetical protein